MIMVFASLHPAIYYSDYSHHRRAVVLGEGMHQLVLCVSVRLRPHWTRNILSLLTHERWRDKGIYFIESIKIHCYNQNKSLSNFKAWLSKGAEEWINKETDGMANLITMRWAVNYFAQPSSKNRARAHIFVRALRRVSLWAHTARSVYSRSVRLEVNFSLNRAAAKTGCAITMARDGAVLFRCVPPRWNEICMRLYETGGRFSLLSRAQTRRAYALAVCMYILDILRHGKKVIIPAGPQAFSKLATAKKGCWTNVLFSHCERKWNEREYEKKKWTHKTATFISHLTGFAAKHAGCEKKIVSVGLKKNR
jgi:hypothetical protein